MSPFFRCLWIDLDVPVFLGRGGGGLSDFKELSFCDLVDLVFNSNTSVSFVARYNCSIDLKPIMPILVTLRYNSKSTAFL